MSLPAFSVRQVVLVNLIFVLLLVAGVQSARRIPVDLFPDISFNQALILTPWSGASPGEVERLLTKKLEDEIDGISGLKEIVSVSGQGLSEIYIEWDESLSDLEYEAAVNDLRAAIDRADELPEDAETPILRELSVSEAFNILMVAVSDVGGVGEFANREIARDLQKKLEDLPGLRHASMRGDRDRELRVLVDKNRALQYDLTLPEIIGIVTNNNQNFAGGSFTNRDSEEITVRGLGNFRSVEELAATVVKNNRGGSHVRLRDVAEIVDGFEKRRMIGRFNGHPTIMLGISKENDTDIIEVVAMVREFVERYRANLPEGIDVSLTWDQAAYVDHRLQIMKSNLVLGVVFVVFVLWLSVGFRNSMLAIIGVPFSFLTALVLFPIFDITINSLSLIGFVMVSGMLVDDAIIILENIYRHIEAGVPLKEAAVKGTEEVMWPVTAAIATTVAAFIPMLLITGTSGEFMSILPKTVIVCLIGSLFEALVILPAHYIDFGSRKAPSDSLAAMKTRGISRLSYAARLRVDRFIHSSRDVYLVAQARLLAHRWAFLGLSLAALFFAINLNAHVPVDLFPSDFSHIMATVEAPTDDGIETTSELVREMEAALDPIRDELTDVISYTGLSMDADENPVVGVNHGVLYLSFANTRENAADPNRVLTLVRSELERFRDANVDRVVSLRVAPPRNGPPIGKPVAIRIQSESYDEAKEIAAEMKAALATIPGVYNIEDNVPLGPRELRVSLHEHRASLHGLTFDDLGFALLAANDGAISSTFRDPDSDEDIDIRIQLRGEQRRTISDLLDVSIRSAGGYLVELGDVADIEIERGYQKLYHYDTERAVVVYADVDDEQATSITVNDEMHARFRDIPARYPGVNLVFGGEYQATAQTFGEMGRAFILALMAIYGILAAQFKSYLQPFIVMSVIAFSFIGVTVGIFLLGYALSMYVIYAMVGLAGIVVNDSLVLIDFVNQARAGGNSALEAVVSASRKRFRPILLTTITTVVGLMPMALGLTGKSVVYGPFAAAIVFGLAFASLLTLFVVPSLYLGIEDAKAAFERRFGRSARASALGSAASGSQPVSPS